MIQLGFIGTSKIAGNFADAITSLPDLYTLHTVYSRTQTTGQKFADTWHFSNVCTSLEELANNTEIDAVYIASPNSCHFSQTKQMLSAKKHVICEKPLTTSLKETEELFALAEKNNVILLEAMRPAFDPSTQVVLDNLHRLGTIRRVDLPFCQYSSRYDNFKKGDIANVFNPDMGGGALLDLGIYALYYLAMVMGSPKTVTEMHVELDNGVCATGSILATYENAIAQVSYSKTHECHIPATIQGEQGYITINKLNDPYLIQFFDGKGHEETLYQRDFNNNMVYEAEAFAKMIEGNLSPESYKNYSLIAMKIIEMAR